MRARILKSFLPLLAMTLVSLAAPTARAQIPQTINYQGYLTNTASQPVSAAVNVTFRIYTAASGGSPVWSETQNGIGVANGVFTAVLGSAAALNLPFNVPYFLSLQVNTDAEMSARQPLSAVPYALRAVSADGVATSATIPAAQLTGTLASSQFSATQLLPTTACTANQFSQWNGTAWICAAGTGTTTTSDVTGNLTMVNSTASAGNVLKGGALFIHSIGSDNAFLGINAGNTAMSGQYNAGLGALALGQLTNGYGNAANGAWAMKDNTTGFFNAAGGAFALQKNTSGNSNSGFGMEALSGVTSGNNNIGIGASAGSAITTGSGNIAIGNFADVTDTGVVRIGRANTHVKTFVAGIRGVSPGVADALPVVIDSNGQLGTGAAAGGGIVSITAGNGLTGGTITSAGTIGLAATQLLPVSPCAANQSPQWNGSAWTCASGTIGAQGPVGPAGPTGPQGPAGSVDAATNLSLPASTATAGNILKGGVPFIHNIGTANTFIGVNAGNLTLTGSGNTASGFYALSANTSGGSNTATGGSALQSNTTGSNNTANGVGALLANLAGSFNTAIGVNTLVRNSAGNNNTANGASALYFNTTGNGNTASGVNALQNNVTGYNNTASGMNALQSNTTGINNIATGVNALQKNTAGFDNNAIGNNALANNVSGVNNIAVGGSTLVANTTGNQNIAVGANSLLRSVRGDFNIGIGTSALINSIDGSVNVALGHNALNNATGDRNIAIGQAAGQLIETGSNNITIAHNGLSTDAGTIRIGTPINQTSAFIAGIRGTTTQIANAIPVFIDSAGQLGTVSSSLRVKDNITDMDAASSALMQLRPVTFHYKSDQNPAGRSLQYGLVAEEVAEIYPGLIAHSADGQIETVMYQFLPPMLLNEVQKQHRAIERLHSMLQAKDREIDAVKRDLAAIKQKLGLD